MLDIMRSFLGLRQLCIGLLLAAMLLGTTAASGRTAAVGERDYIVVLKDGRDPVAAAARQGVTPTYVYDAALSGYAARLSPALLKKVAADPDTSNVELDEVTLLEQSPPQDSVTPQPPQLIDTGVRRIGGLRSPTAKIDGIDERVDIDVAILDSGIDVFHPDLNVVGGKNCGPGKGYDDAIGHGTSVAGVVGAIDNEIGRVGVAPGARLWAVRVTNRNGGISMSAVICAVDWVTKHADVIDVANMSFGQYKKKIRPCTDKRNNAFHRAVCKSVDAGVTYVAAAGNDATDSSTDEPSAFPEVISVSAMADADGRRGGRAGEFECWAYPGTDPENDDSFADFSNFGPTIDLAAPGFCLDMPYPYSVYTVWSGTSFASPHVAGAAALYLAKHPNATPAQVRAALIAGRERVTFPDDPDGIAEGIVNVAGY